MPNLTFPFITQKIKYIQNPPKHAIPRKSIGPFSNEINNLFKNVLTGQSSLSLQAKYKSICIHHKIDIIKVNKPNKSYPI